MKGRILLAVSVSIFTLTLAASPANAQATRTWVSGVGDDANPCSRTAPCKTFAGAISKTAPGGEINCLDPAGYGTLNVTKSITVDCGQYTMGGVLAANVNGFLINGLNIVVTLRGLNINGANTTTGNGVRIIQAAAVNIDDTVIENFGGAGPSNGRGVAIETSTANVRVNITDSQIYNNNFVGIHSNPTGGNVILDVDNVTMGRSAGNGVNLRQLTAATVNRTTITGHSAAVATELTTVTLMVSNSNLSNNAIGVFNGNAGGAPTTRLYANVITGNTNNGLLINGGSVFTHGNNAIRGNAGNETPTGVSLGTQ